MHSPKISVIVPVYNTEQYLHRCIDSILAQTFTDFELLLINDGSTDSSGAICDGYAQKDSRIRVFHKENGGVSSARNVGLDNATGEWITFCDSDDEVNGWGITNSDGSDLILGAVEVQKLNEKTKLQSFSNEHLWGEQLTIFLEENLHQQIFSVCWAKYFKRELIGKLRFDTSMKIGEDTVFMLRYLNLVNCISFNRKFIYTYYWLSSYESKYQLTIKESIYIMSSIFETYSQLNIQNTEFERNVFLNYKGCCQQEIYINPSLWYNNFRVNSIYKRVAKEIGITYRIKYRFMAIPMFSKMLNNIRKSNNSIK